MLPMSVSDPNAPATPVGFESVSDAVDAVTIQ
jgi:hypothetical protein